MACHENIRLNERIFLLRKKYTSQGLEYDALDLIGYNTNIYSMKKKSRIILSISFTVLHYALAFAVFVIMASYATDIDGLNPSLTRYQDMFLTVAFYLLLFPFGYLPLGLLFNSALLGVGMYFFSGWRAKRNPAS